MRKITAIGLQSFEEIISEDCFYVDKTEFIKKWWESKDKATLITRPRRFGKTLNMSMLECFFSIKYANREDLFEGLNIWKDEKYRKLQGTYPVIFLSFANVKGDNYEQIRDRIYESIVKAYREFDFIRDGGVLDEIECKKFNKVLSGQIRETDATSALNQLSDFLYRYYGKKVIIILDEYDTPMQEAYVKKFWSKLISFTRSLFNSTFKTNDYLERGIMTGITRVSKASVFSDLNNLKVVTTTSNEYATDFGFTEEEVFNALDEYGYGNKKAEVQQWYDGFVFGKCRDMYNPWSILNFLDVGKFDAYWANTSSNDLVNELIRKGDKDVKIDFEDLLRGETITCEIDEQIVFNQLDNDKNAIWSLLVASGYLKVVDFEEPVAGDFPKYELKLTNLEVKRTFRQMVRSWFSSQSGNYHGFVSAMLKGDLDAMNVYINEITLRSFSFFDTGASATELAPEQFYHGFVLGLLADLDDYLVSSNRESGLGRYDIMLEPMDKSMSAIIIEFKVFRKTKEKTLNDTAQAALSQIEEKMYDKSLLARGFSKKQIHKYGFAFKGKEVLIVER